MTIPVYIPPHHGPPTHLGLGGFGLALAVPCAVMGLLIFACTLWKWLRAQQYTPIGGWLVEGLGVVHVKRLTETLLELDGGKLLLLSDAPLTLNIGGSGEVRGILVLGDADPGADYRVSARPCAGRLLPVGGRYELVPTPWADAAALRTSLWVLITATIMTAVAIYARGVPEGDLGDALFFGWLVSAFFFAVALFAWLAAWASLRGPGGDA